MAMEGRTSKHAGGGRLRALLALAALTAAAGAAAWAAGDVLAVRRGNSESGPTAAAGGIQDEIIPARYAKGGARSIVALVLCAAAVALAVGPARRGRPGWARLAAAEIALSGLVLAAIVLLYCLCWSPLTFLR